MYLETLPASAYELLKSIGKFDFISRFYLAGGSAAALHLGHRISVDLDFFSRTEFFEPDALQRALISIGPFKVQQQSSGTLVGSLKETQISFFSYPYPLVETGSVVEGIQVASLIDIALMKIIAINQRGAYRDFVDLYFICKTEIKLDGLLALIPQKYSKIEYPSYQILRSLVYFSDAEKDAPLHSIALWDWQEVKQFFEMEVKHLMEKFKYR